MAKGATLANTNVSGLGEALSGVSANASAYGQASDSVTLSLLKLAEANVTGSNATTALNSAMSEVYTPTDQAKRLWIAWEYLHITLMELHVTLTMW